MPGMLVSPCCFSHCSLRRLRTYRPGFRGEVQAVALALSEERFAELVASGPGAVAAVAGGAAAVAPQDHAQLLSLSLPPPGARLVAGAWLVHASV